MALESATYLDQLNSANPTPTDSLGQGDDHIRLIKAVLQATFPNITGPVTLNQGDINGMLTLISGGGVPVGCITAWYGSSATVPTGWHICDGNVAVPKSDGTGTIAVPDLRDKVVMGVGALAVQGASYGAANQSATTSAGGAHTHSITADGAHSHNATVAGHALTTSEIPAHSHGFHLGGSGGGLDGAGGTGGAATTFNTDSTGGGAAHTHGLTFTGTDGTHTHTVGAAATHTHGVTIPVYQPALSLHYIMKV